jgi:hypothetical protein
MRLFNKNMAQKLVKKQVNPDTILDKEDLKAIAEARQEKAEGKLVSWEEVKRRLGVNVRRQAK